MLRKWKILRIPECSRLEISDVRYDFMQEALIIKFKNESYLAISKELRDGAKNIFLKFIFCVPILSKVVGSQEIKKTLFIKEINELKVVEILYHFDSILKVSFENESILLVGVRELKSINKGIRLKLMFYDVKK